MPSTTPAHDIEEICREPDSPTASTVTAEDICRERKAPQSVPTFTLPLRVCQRGHPPQTKQRTFRRKPKPYSWRKLTKHAGSENHVACLRTKEQATRSELKEAVLKAQTVWDEANAEKLEATCKVFHSTYTCAKEELPFSKHPAIIELQELNGCMNTSTLYSHQACANILQHVAQEMKTELNTYIRESFHPFSIMIDETTTLSTN